MLLYSMDIIIIYYGFYVYIVEVKIIRVNCPQAELVSCLWAYGLLFVDLIQNQNKLTPAPQTRTQTLNISFNVNRYWGSYVIT